MFVRGYCEIEGWPEAARRDLDHLLAGEMAEWQGESWTRINGAEYYETEDRGGKLVITNDETNEEPFDSDNLLLCAQSVMRHHGIESVIRIKTWGEPEGGEDAGDGMVTYVSRYGSVNISPFYSDRGGQLEGLSRMVDGWKDEIALMESPERREARLGPDANLWAAERNGAVHVGPLPSLGGMADPRLLDIAAKGGSFEIVANVADLFPDARVIEPIALPRERMREIREAAREFGLAPAGPKSGPKG